MKSIAGFSVLVTALVSSAGAAFAQSDIAHAVILICDVEEISGPAVLNVQVSKELKTQCESPSEDDMALCEAIDAVADETSCANAIAMLNGIGTAQAASHQKTWLRSNFRVEVDGLPAGAPADSRHQEHNAVESPFTRKPHVLYVLKSPDNAVSLVGCNLSDLAPLLVFSQDPEGGDDGSAADSGEAISCADALQTRFARGETVANEVVVHSWDPIAKVTISDQADARPFHPEIDDEVLVAFLQGDLNAVVYVFGVPSSRAP